jgi:hypothetical protein
MLSQIVRALTPGGHPGLHAPRPVDGTCDAAPQEIRVGLVVALVRAPETQTPLGGPQIKMLLLDQVFGHPIGTEALAGAGDETG